MLRNSREALTQVLLLGCHTNRAAVEVTDTGHHATLGDHGDRTEAVLLGAEQGSDHHIPAGLETAVGPEQNTIAKTVLKQCTMHLCKPQFPGATRMLDRTQR